MLTPLLALLVAFSPQERAAMNRITANEISAHIRFLSDDQLEGRKPGSPGDELAVKYLASQLEAMGYKPAGDNGGYFQKVPMVELQADIPADVVFKAGDKALTLHTSGGLQSDLVLDPAAQKDLEQIKDAPLVFAGYGISAPEYGWDDYKDADVKGKVVVLLNFNPPFKGEKVRLWYGRWDYKYLNAAKHGAAGALIIHTTESAGYPWQVLVTSSSTPRQRLPATAGEPSMEFQGWITEPAAYKLLPDLDGLRKAAQGKDFKPAPLNSSMSLSMPVHVRQFDSVNVIGTLAGTDPRLREQAVLYTAHHDHLGAVKPVPPATDGIYNGANDNASGCATLLAIARALTFAPPRRSTLIAFVTAEEQGLLGSEYLAHHPPIPADRIAVDINFDEINKWGKSRDVRALGLGKSSVDKPLLAAAKEQGRAVTGDVRPDLGQFYRSDQFSLARVGVPGIYLKAGRDFVGKPQGWGDVQLNSYFQRDYHQPSDEYHGDWDLSGDVQDAQLQLVVGLRIANAPAMPTWNPGDEFEKARKTASK